MFEIRKLCRFSSHAFLLNGALIIYFGYIFGTEIVATFSFKYYAYFYWGAYLRFLLIKNTRHHIVCNKTRILFSA